MHTWQKFADISLWLNWIGRQQPFKEIAEREHISINTALGRMRYALLNMRRLAVERDLQPYVC